MGVNSTAWPQGYDEDSVTGKKVSGIRWALHECQWPFLPVPKGPAAHSEHSEQEGAWRTEAADKTSVGCSFGKWDLVRKMNAATSG